MSDSRADYESTDLETVFDPLVSAGKRIVVAVSEPVLVAVLATVLCACYGGPFEPVLLEVL